MDAVVEFFWDPEDRVEQGEGSRREILPLAEHKALVLESGALWFAGVSNREFDFVGKYHPTGEYNGYTIQSPPSKHLKSAASKESGCQSGHPGGTHGIFKFGYPVFAEIGR